MSPGFIKGLLVSAIVFGVEGLLLGTCLLFRAGSRAKAIRCLLRSGLDVIVFSVAFYLFKRGFTFDDFSLGVLLFGFAVMSLTLEGVMNRSFRTVLSPEPMKRETWLAGKATKRQFVSFITLACGLLLVTPAIVFTIVAPEVMPAYWWPILIVLMSLVGLVFARWYWNSFERKFGSRSEPSQR